MAGASVCPAKVLLLLLAMAAFASGAAAVQPSDSTGPKKTSKLLPVHHKTAVDKLAEAGVHRNGASGDLQASFASTDEDGKVVGSDWGKVKKMDNDDDDDDDDKGGSDHDHDSDHDSDSDHDHDSDSDDDHDHDSDYDHDHDSDSDHDHDSDSDSDHDSDSCSKRGSKKKKHAPRKEKPGGKHDDELPKV